MLRIHIPEASGPQFIEIKLFRNYDKLIIRCAYFTHACLRMFGKYVAL